MTWQPGRRAQQRLLESPYEDVPAHLLQPLRAWITDGLLTPAGSWRSERFQQLAMHLRVGLPQDSHHAYQLLDSSMGDNSTIALDLAEAILELYGWDGDRAEKLAQVLRMANSAYAVKDDGRGLELRVLPEVKGQVQSVVDLATGSPGDHLRDAWSAAYGRTPDPTKAYSEAIKAVEASMAPIVSPSNSKATLGTMIRDIKAKPSKWTFEINGGQPNGVEVVLDMAQLLWNGQTSRHGGVQPTRPERADEARAAVHLATTLVQFATGSAFRTA